jgi:hypothetical protein
MRRFKPNMKNALHQTKPSDPKILALKPEFPSEVAEIEFINYRAAHVI